MEKMLLKSTTRHVRIFTAEVVDEELKFVGYGKVFFYILKNNNCISSLPVTAGSREPSQTAKYLMVSSI